MHTEHEAKLLAPPDLELPDLAGVVDGVLAGTPQRRELDAIYHDTADLALARSGVTLRHRTGEAGPPWTLKLPAERKGSALSRGELSFDGPADPVPAPARDLVLAYLRSRSLTRTVQVRTDRTAVELSDRAGTPLLEVVDDHVAAYEGEHRTEKFREVEVELLGDPGRPDLLRAVVDRLIAAGCRAEPPIPKLVRALGSAAAEPPDLAVPGIGPDPTAGQLVQHAIAKSVLRLVRHDAGVRLGEDPEDVHQFRVATRRLRSDLRTYRSVLDPDWVGPLRAELRWLAAEMGGVRDNDVLGERLRTQIEALPDPDTGGVAVLIGRLTEQGERARAALLEALRGERYVALLDALVGAARQPAFAKSSTRPADQPAAGLVADLVRGQWRRLRNAVEHLGDPPSDTELHEVRILAKRCRYAAEAAVPVHDRPAAKFAAAIADVQTVLGDHHDAIVAEEWLRTTRDAVRDDGLAILIGQLIAVQRAEDARLRAAWPAAWRAASAKRLRGWL